MQKERQEGYRQARERTSLKHKRMTLGLPYQYTPPVPPTASTCMSSPSPTPSPSSPHTSVPKHDLPISSTTTLPFSYGTTTPPLICESPLPVWPCDGLCPPDYLSLDAAFSPDGDDTPLVLAFGACKDDQVSWEGADGSSMSTALFDILSATPNPTLTELMSRLSMRMHSSALKRHWEWRDYKRRLKAFIGMGGTQTYGKEEEGWAEDIENFQDPQVRSSGFCER